MNTNLFITLPLLLCLYSCGKDETFNTNQESPVAGEWRWMPPKKFSGPLSSKDSCWINDKAYAFVKCTWADYLLTDNGNLWKINRKGTVLMGPDLYADSVSSEVTACEPIEVDSSWSEEGIWWKKENRYFLKVGESYEALDYVHPDKKALIGGRSYTRNVSYY
ncbi:hypothetical protein KFE98_15865 [bacterium SCSIO 12741]|nr:hypothetical protein KFE98_15865 [bacterium SCSIO 12741]